MRRTRSRCRRTSAAEHGFSLIELTITVSLLALVMATFAGALVSSQRSESFAEDRSQTLDDLQTTMARITKDTRQATSIDAASTASLLDIHTYVDGVAATVAYQINGRILTRSVNGGAGIVLVTNLASPSLFTYDPPVLSQTNVVQILLQATPKRSPDTTVHLTSEVRLRNLSNS
jgi:prepilin-type N-terminal cleavage/methylation domain-containing protein